MLRGISRAPAALSAHSILWRADLCARLVTQRVRSVTQSTLQFEYICHSSFVQAHRCRRRIKPSECQQKSTSSFYSNFFFFSRSSHSFNIYFLPSFFHPSMLRYIQNSQLPRDTAHTYHTRYQFSSKGSRYRDTDDRSERIDH